MKETNDVCFRNSLSEETILYQFNILGVECMHENVWYPHRDYPSLLISRIPSDTDQNVYKFALLGEVSKETSPNVYDPWDIPAMMDSQFRPDSMEGIYCRAIYNLGLFNKGEE